MLLDYTDADGISRSLGFNGHPPLGVNATWEYESGVVVYAYASFNGHPPLGVNATEWEEQLFKHGAGGFNGHPPLGVNATSLLLTTQEDTMQTSFNGHPPLGVNATGSLRGIGGGKMEFQWAPTLGGECYRRCTQAVAARKLRVSMGTHPWG